MLPVEFCLDDQDRVVAVMRPSSKAIQIAHDLQGRKYDVLDYFFEMFRQLGPGWQLSQSDWGGYPDDQRWWCWLPTEYGGDSFNPFMAATPLEVILKAITGEKEYLRKAREKDESSKVSKRSSPL